MNLTTLTEQFLTAEDPVIVESSNYGVFSKYTFVSTSVYFTAIFDTPIHTNTISGLLRLITEDLIHVLQVNIRS